MTPQIQEIFQPLHDILMAGDMEDSDVFDLLGNFSQETPAIAVAMSFHIRDYILERAEEQFGWNEVISEAYRRTFFDEPHARKYGTQEMLERGPDYLKKFVDYMTGNLKMDEHMVGTLFPIQETAHNH